LLANLPNFTFYLPKRLTDPGDAQQERVRVFQESFRQALQSTFIEHKSLVCSKASGIVVREIAPLRKNNHSDPAVVVLDAEGRFGVSLLSGHEGGANALALQIAAITGGQEIFVGGLF
jgi:cobalamin biosynthesis protein CbiG